MWYKESRINILEALLFNMPFHSSLEVDDPSLDDDGRPKRTGSIIDIVLSSVSGIELEQIWNHCVEL